MFAFYYHEGITLQKWEIVIHLRSRMDNSVCADLVKQDCAKWLRGLTLFKPIFK